jgi:hypothetical protein
MAEVKVKAQNLPAQKEKPFQMDIFNIYCQMGEERTLHAVAKKSGIGERTLEKWSQIFGWRVRAREYDERTAAQIKFESLEELTEHKKKAIEIAKAQLIEAEKSIVRDPETGKIVGWQGKPVSPSWLVEIEKAIELMKRDILEPVQQTGPGSGYGSGGAAIQINISKD